MFQIDLSGKVAVVTGSSRGIGKAMALTFARAGASVVVSSRKAEACRAVVEEITAAGGRAIAIASHVGAREQCDALIDGATQVLGQVDLLVCNAAVSPYYGAAADEPEEVYDKIMTINLRSNVWLWKRVFPQMKARRSGVVILTSSGGGLVGSAELGSYCISKAGQLQLARNLAAEGGPHGVRVNAIAPGLIRTDFARGIMARPELLARIEASVPLRRIGEPQDVAGVALFLASDLGAYVTGQVLSVDGGSLVSGH